MLNHAIYPYCVTKLVGANDFIPTINTDASRSLQRDALTCRHEYILFLLTLKNSWLCGARYYRVEDYDVHEFSIAQVR